MEVITGGSENECVSSAEWSDHRAIHFSAFRSARHIFDRHVAIKFERSDFAHRITTRPCMVRSAMIFV